MKATQGGRKPLATREDRVTLPRGYPADAPPPRRGARTRAPDCSIRQGERLASRTEVRRMRRMRRIQAGRSYAPERLSATAPKSFGVGIDALSRHVECQRGRL